MIDWVSGLATLAFVVIYAVVLGMSR